MKISLWKDILREIWHTLPRFFSIMMMISLGVFVFTGLKGAAPLMRNTIDQFTEQTNMTDIKIEFPLGLNKDDIEILSANPDIADSEWEYSLDLNVKNSELLIQLQSMPDKISTPLLTEGKMPLYSDEILLDETLKDKGYQVGDTISFKKESNKFSYEVSENFELLNHYDFKIVGFVQHPEFLHPSIKGDANNGLGKLNGFGFVAANNFNSDYYQMARFSMISLKNYDQTNLKHKAKSLVAKETFEILLQDRPKDRLAELKQTVEKRIHKGEEKINDAKFQLQDSENKLKEAESKIKDGEAKLKEAKEAMYSSFSKAEQEIASNELLLASKKTELDLGVQKYQLEEKNYTESALKLLEATDTMEANKSILSEQLKTVQERLVQVNDFIVRFEQELANATDDNVKAEINASLSESKVFKQELEQQLQVLREGNTKLQAAESELLLKRSELEAGKTKLEEARAQLDAGKAQYQSALKALEIGKRKLATEKQSAEQKIKDSEAELEDAKLLYEKNKVKFEEEKPLARQKMEDGTKKIEDSKKMLKALKERAYKVSTRDDNPYYFVYYDSAKRMELLSNIFPYFFYLIAMLVCLSTMTRMVEEQRGQIGTLKALGYSKLDIAKKYFYYGLFSSLLGGLIGIAGGQPILSRVVFNAYNSIFVPQEPIPYTFWEYNIYSVLIGVLCTAFVTFVIVNKYLQQSASILMRPKPPKSGNKIALERWRFVWSRMSFLQKVTARNMFRYKARMSMTILGIAGCTGLVFLGFALRHSVSMVIPEQYEVIMRYDYLAFYDEDINPKEADELNSYLANSDKISAYPTISLESVTWKEIDSSEQLIQVIVPKNIEEFTAIHTLRNPAHKKKAVAFVESGAIITDKIARLANLKVGDSIMIKDKDNKKIRIPIKAIAENYLGHFLFLNADSYREFFGKEAVWNTKAIQVNPASSYSTEKMLNDLLDFDIVLTISETRLGSVAQTLDSLDMVVGIIIFVSSLLAFIVLYNLSNINISERIRELSTIKVLGFYPLELTGYVYRETMFLSLIGISLGYVFGILLHKLILQFIVADAFQLYPKVYPLTYLISALLTFLFTAIVMIFVHWRLSKIDMVQALKSYE